MLKTMKKAIALLLVFVMSATLCACGSTRLEGTAVDESIAEEANAEDIGEPAEEESAADEDDAGDTEDIGEPAEEEPAADEDDTGDVGEPAEEEPAADEDDTGDTGEPAEEEPAAEDDDTGDAGEPSEETEPPLDTVAEEVAAAKVIIGGEETLYDNMSDAWTAVNNSTNKDSEMVLLADWIAEDGMFGSGDGYGETGNLTPKDRNKKSIKLTIDLNGHTLDRNLSEPKKSGNIISLKKDGVYTVKNGTLTGGNTSDRGGAVWIDNDETTVYLENLTITGNYANGNGGGIFIKDCDAHITLADCTITGNSTDNYGGAVYLSIGSLDYDKYARVTFRGRMIIRENEGKRFRENLTLQRWRSYNPIITIVALEESSDIYFNVSSNEALGRTAFKTGEEYLLQSTEKCFKADNPDFSAAFNLGLYINLVSP